MTLEIRPAIPDDHDAYVGLFAEFGIPDPVPGKDRFVESIAPQMTIACREGAVLGFVTWRPYGEVAHVVQLAVDRNARGQRIGERLLQHVRELARAAGCTRWYLNVKRDNAPARRLYERVGFEIEFESFAIAVPWSCVPRGAARGALADPAEDAAIAAQLGLPVQRLAMFRSKNRAVRFVTLRDAGTILGFAAFDPTFPGASVFRTSPPLAAELLDAMRAHARPGDDLVHVTIEGDRPLADAVLALGGTLSFELLRLGAALVQA